MRKIEAPKTIEERKIYAYHTDGIVYVLQHLRNIYGFKPLLRGYELSEYSSFSSKETLATALKDGKEIIEFDNQKDFFKYFSKLDCISC
ncbi:MAG: hypothetical protein DSY38_05240 [Fusobacteria bacterium]|nr:MAG: hypothetical protein DSY38_05240 [Fusobacteriota bacterium]